MARRFIVALAAIGLMSAAIVGSAAPAVAITPPPALNITAVQATLTTINVTWELPSVDPADPLLSVGVETSMDGGPWSMDLFYPPTTTSYTADCDVPYGFGHTYSFRIKLVTQQNDTSISAASETLMVTGRPSAPLNLRQLGVGTGQVTLAWDAPSIDGGTPITGYEVWRRDGFWVYTNPWTLVGTTPADAAPSFVDDTAALFSNYTYDVQAVNKWGIGTLSDQIGASNWMPASPVQSASYKLLPHGGVRFSAQLGVVRPQETAGFDVDTANSSLTSIRPTGATTPLFIYWYGTPGQRTTFRVYGYNGLAKSATFVTISLTPADVSGPPRVVKVTGGRGQVLVTWLPPLRNGYSVIRTYRVTNVTTGRTVSLLSSARHVTFKGLVAGRRYVFKIAAVNSVGVGATATTAIVAHQ